MRFDEIVNTLLGEYGAQQQQQQQTPAEVAIQAANDPVSKRKAVNIAIRTQAGKDEYEKETLKAAEIRAQQFKKAAADLKKANAANAQGTPM